tara:strand:- start:988 stop:1332 length:345 start_codon:yes stop_codon:yes gene_type:complete
MKNIYILFCLVFVILNSIIGLIFSFYPLVNWLTANFVIIINAVLLNQLVNSNINDAFKVSLSFIFPVMGVITFILSLFMPEKIEDNLMFATMLIIFTFQLVLYIIVYLLKNNKS